MVEPLQTIEVEVTGKNPWLSKTLWWNVLATVAQSADVLVGAGIIPQPWGMVITGLVNLVLRARITQPLAIGSEPPKMRALVSTQEVRRFFQTPPGI